jgi:hypothetical protein
MFLEQFHYSLVITGLWLAVNFLPKSGLMSDTHPEASSNKKICPLKKIPFFKSKTYKSSKTTETQPFFITNNKSQSWQNLLGSPTLNSRRSTPTGMRYAFCHVQD